MLLEGKINFEGYAFNMWFPFTRNIQNYTAWTCRPREDPHAICNVLTDSKPITLGQLRVSMTYLHGIEFIDQKWNFVPRFHCHLLLEKGIVASFIFLNEEFNFIMSFFYSLFICWVWLFDVGRFYTMIQIWAVSHWPSVMSFFTVRLWKEYPYVWYVMPA